TVQVKVAGAGRVGSAVAGGVVGVRLVGRRVVVGGYELVGVVVHIITGTVLVGIDLVDAACVVVSEGVARERARAPAAAGGRRIGGVNERGQAAGLVVAVERIGHEFRG